MRLIPLLALCIIGAAYQSPILYAQTKGRKKIQRAFDATQTPSTLQPPTRNPHYTRSKFTTPDGQQLHFWLMTPADLSSATSFPLVLALHGYGGNAYAADVLGSEAMRIAHPCFVLVPAVDKRHSWKSFRPIVGGLQESLPAVLQLLDDTMRRLPVDSSQVYVTGQSMGGVGTFAAVAARPDCFAAAVPVCGAWGVGDASRLATTPMLIFHGEKDEIVSVSFARNITQAIKNVDGVVEYIEIKNADHGIADSAYARPQLWEWLFRQRRTKH